MGGTENTAAFGGVQCPLADSAAIILPVSYDLTSSYSPGARFGPRALIEASTHMELFDDALGCSPIDVGVHTMDIMEQVASGPEAMVRRISEEIGGVLQGGRLPILIGGEHSVSIGAFLAIEEQGMDVTVLQFDAHADLREEYQGTPYSHACVMARARERFPAVQIGIRSMSAPEHERIRRDALPVYPTRLYREDREELLAQASRNLGPRIYVTIDLDVLDPSIMPATGTPEPGGLLWYDLLWLVRNLTRGREVVGFDIVELAPIAGLPAPDFLAAKLLNKVLGLTKPPEVIM